VPVKRVVLAYVFCTCLLPVLYYLPKKMVPVLGTCKANGNGFGAGKASGFGIWFWHLVYIIYRRKWYLYLVPVKLMEIFVVPVKRVVLVYVFGTCYILLYRIKWCLQGGGVK
jgi:hypothetical protein